VTKNIVKICVIGLLVLVQQLSLAADVTSLASVQQSSMAMETLADSSCVSMPACLEGDHRPCPSACAGSAALPSTLDVMNHGMGSFFATAYIHNPTVPLLSPPDPPPQT
jgi:hypothetical protein